MIIYKLIPDPLDFYMSLFNEAAASTYLYLLIGLTDFYGENLQR
jgi:hypothetical protein